MRAGVLKVLSMLVTLACYGVTGSSVLDFGAVGNGTADDTAAFSAALTQASVEGGGIVQVPTGRFLISDTLVIPSNVTLEGLWRAPSRARSKQDGSTLLFVSSGGTTGSIELRSQATVKGLAVHYPNQGGTTPYPWAIVGKGDHCTIVDVMLINPWDGVDFGSNPCDYHYINGLFGEALNRGLYLDQSTGGTIENIHWWVFDELGKSLTREEALPMLKQLTWRNVNGTAFLVGNVDRQKAFNCFDIFYAVSWHFGDFGHGVGNGVYTNIYPDITPLAFKIDGVDSSGITIANGLVFAEAEVAATNTGPVRFISSSFMAANNAATQGFVTHSHMRFAGQGPITVDACHFSNWDMPSTEASDGSAAIEANCDTLIVTGCEFSGDQTRHIAVRLGSGVRSAVLSANRIRAGSLLDDLTTSGADVQAALNSGGTSAKALEQGVDQ
jgi:hypothetical protein